MLNEKLKENIRLNEEIVLDLGAGTGSYKYILNIKNYLGFDVNPKPKQNIPFIKGDFHFLPFKDESFDCILMIESLQYAKDPMKVVREIHRVLKKDGVLFISIPYIYPFDHGELWRFSRRAIKHLFKDFEIEFIEAIGNRRLIILMYGISIIPLPNVIRKFLIHFIKLNLGSKTEVATGYLIKARKKCRCDDERERG